MTQEQMATVQKVINRIASKYVFGPYEFEDICQEAWGFAMEALDKWDGVRPLENFLAVVLPRKLRNLKRNKFCRLDIGEKYVSINEAKKNLMQMAEYFEGEDELRECSEKMGGESAVKLVLENLPVAVRADFLRLANGVSIPKIRKDKVYEKVREILRDY